MDMWDDLLNEEDDDDDDDEYFHKLKALNELRREYGPPELYPKYEGWKHTIFSSN
jgi:hypothetical protein